MSFFHRGGGKNTSLDQARSQEKGRSCDVLALDVSTELGVDSPLYRHSRSNPIDSSEPTW